MRRLRVPAWSLLFVSLVGSVNTAAFAQTGATSSLSGTVVDASGGVIPGASVNLKNDATGVEFNTVTDDSGIFLLPAVPPGTYTLTTTLPGFKKQIHPHLVLDVAMQGTITVVLETGTLEESGSV
jgi:Carboxypeptidase regulatory-like domain